MTFAHVRMKYKPSYWSCNPSLYFIHWTLYLSVQIHTKSLTH